MWKNVLGLCLLAAVATVGCEKEIVSPVDNSDPVPKLVKALESNSSMAVLAAIGRLGTMGDKAKAAIPALKEVAKKQPKLKARVDHAIGKIEGRIPLDAPQPEI